MDSKIKKLNINKASLHNLPVFYNHIMYIEMEKGVPHYHYNEKLSGYVQYGLPEKPISKIIDLSIKNSKL